MKNKFNLITEPWIPVANHGRVSLKQIFTNPDYASLGGNPVQKIAVLKLLLAIAQAAATPRDENAWKTLGVEGLGKRCLEYLDKWHGHFYLYGEKPFLQMPKIVAARPICFSALMPQAATGNTTVLTEIQMKRSLDDGEKALLLVSLMGFALGGKKVDNSIVLTPGYSGKRNDKDKPSTGKSGPSLGHMGFLHSFVLGKNIRETLWLNLFSEQAIAQINLYAEGLGQAPWEAMPEGENCLQAQKLKQSLMGRLIPLCRFCLIAPEGMHYSEGIAHPSYKDGALDPSMAVNSSPKIPKALWADPEKRPWRELTSLLSCSEQGGSQSFQCWQLRNALDRVRDVAEVCSIWSGGLRVSSNAGEQYITGSDDFVESQVWLYSDELGQTWFNQLKQEMGVLDTLAKTLYGCVLNFFKEQKADGSQQAAQATHLFWQLCERDFQSLLDSCEQSQADKEKRKKLRQIFAAYVRQAYSAYCPRATARQLDAWAKHRPNTHKYVTREV